MDTIAGAGKGCKTNGHVITLITKTLYSHIIHKGGGGAGSKCPKNLSTFFVDVLFPILFYLISIVSMNSKMVIIFRSRIFPRVEFCEKGEKDTCGGLTTSRKF